MKEARLSTFEMSCLKELKLNILGSFMPIFYLYICSVFFYLFVCLFHLFFIPLKYSTLNNFFVWIFAIVVLSKNVLLSLREAWIQYHQRFLNKNSLHTMVANMASPLRKTWFFVNNMNKILIFFPYSRLKLRISIEQTKD